MAEKRTVTNSELGLHYNSKLGLDHPYTKAWRAALAALERDGRVPSLETEPRAHKLFDLKTFDAWYRKGGRKLIEDRAGIPPAQAAKKQLRAV